MKNSMGFAVYFVSGVLLMILSLSSLAFADNTYWYGYLLALLFGILSIMHAFNLSSQNVQIANNKGGEK